MKNSARELLGLGLFFVKNFWREYTMFVEAAILLMI
jgi:hypothetical protein